MKHITKKTVFLTFLILSFSAYAQRGWGRTDPEDMGGNSGFGTLIGIGFTIFLLYKIFHKR